MKRIFKWTPDGFLRDTIPHIFEVVTFDFMQPMRSITRYPQLELLQVSADGREIDPELGGVPPGAELPAPSDRPPQPYFPDLEQCTDRLQHLAARLDPGFYAEDDERLLYSTTEERQSWAAHDLLLMNTPEAIDLAFGWLLSSSGELPIVFAFLRDPPLTSEVAACLASRGFRSANPGTRFCALGLLRHVDRERALPIVAEALRDEPDPALRASLLALYDVP